MTTMTGYSMPTKTPAAPPTPTLAAAWVATISTPVPTIHAIRRPGHASIDCDEGDLCTNDYCDPFTGACFHSPKIPHNDEDPCTDDSCDPQTGLTIHTPVDCDDGDPCTEDDCGAAAKVGGGTGGTPISQVLMEGQRQFSTSAALQWRLAVPHGRRIRFVSRWAGHGPDA